MKNPPTAAVPRSAPKGTGRSLGQITLVGTGPGDPGLLTVRAVDRLRQAEVLVGDLERYADLVAMTPPTAEHLDTSDRPTPAALAKTLAKQAKTGRWVVVLLPGDPFVDAAAADLATAVVKAGVPLEVVPGVSAATAVPAYAGVPLTAGKAGGIAVVPAGRTGVDWSAYAATDTLVLLDGARVIGEVAAALLRAGRDPATPVAMTFGGTTAEQRTLVSTLATVAADAAALAVTGPGVTVVGDVVAQRDRLSWFESRPLFGWRVLVPRTKEQAGSLSTALAAYGAMPVEVPTIAVEPPRTPQQMERAAKGLVTGRYEWVAFTSRNAVRAVREKFEEYGLDARAFSGIKVAAVGEQTAADLVAWGIRPDLVPEGEQSSAGLLDVWPAYDPALDPIDRVFLPRADIATETLVAGLRDLGWQPDDVTAYRTVRAAPPAAEVREAIKSGGFDAVVFTSSSTVRNLVGIAGKPHPATVVACIGPQTAKTAEEHGLRVDVLAATPAMVALAEALAGYGAALRDSAAEAGEPPLRPSQRRPAARRKAT